MPKPVMDFSTSMRFESYAASVTFITGAAGLTGQVTVPAPILSLNADKVGSHWRKNPVWGVKTPVETVSVVETATAAAFVVYDSANNLENLFEGVTSGRFIAKLTIDGASEIYGFIGGIAKSGDSYTFSVYNSAALATQSWIGSLPSGRAVRKLEIFQNETSLVWTTGTILTREIPWDFAATSQQAIMDLLRTMSNGDYAVDYARGKIYYKKATTGVSDTATYNTRSGSSVTTVASADAMSNPTAAQGLSYLFGFNGSTWDRIKAGVTTVTSTLTGFLNTLPWAVFNTSPTTRTNGQGGPLQANNAGDLQVNENTLSFYEDSTLLVAATQERPLSANTYAYTFDVSSALEASTVSKASAGNVFRVFGVIDKTAATGLYYVLTLDAASLPSNGAVTHLLPPQVINHTQNTDSEFDSLWINNGKPASTGVVVALSTTMVTLTVAGSYFFGTVVTK
jgi:hypothetical protein